MPTGPPDANEVTAIRIHIEQFIQGRLNTKLEKLKKEVDRASSPYEKRELEDKRQQLVDEHQQGVWLASAAKRASQIQLVTHGAKFTHPSAGGSSLHLDTARWVTADALVGTHLLTDRFESDVVGNAAALDVYRFLATEYSGKTLLELIKTRNAALLSALSDSPEQAADWAEQLSAIHGVGQIAASHYLSKQLFFPLPNGGYHLLAPLFPTSLVHSVHKYLQTAMFSDEAKLAKRARFRNSTCDHGYSDFPDLATQNFGGSKPQNVSQLNSERRGENWLLPSLPPTWKGSTVRPPLRVPSVFGRWFGSRPRVRDVSKTLSKFLASVDYNNVQIRRTREKLVEFLVDELCQFTAEVAELTPGWSTDPECRLDQAEILWLDPGRAETDDVFSSQRQRIDWPGEIASRFGNWLNGQLRYHNSLPVGEAEHTEWIRVVEPALEDIRKELRYG